MLLPSLGDEIEGTLLTLLEPIGQAIASSIAGSHERTDVFKKRYRDEASYLEAAEEQVIEEFLGIAFVAVQTSITAVWSRLIKLRLYAKARNNVELVTTPGTKRDILRYKFQPTQKHPHSRIEILDAFANYYKHRDEWGPDWSNLKCQQLQTARIISSVGAFQSSPRNLRTGAKCLGDTDYGNVSVFAKILSAWRKDLVRDYSAEIRSKQLT